VRSLFSEQAPLYEKSENNNGLATLFKHLMFECNNGEIVSKLARCNVIEECVDGSDEKGCLFGYLSL
jgi:hypothetical protein